VPQSEVISPKQSDQHQASMWACRDSGSDFRSTAFGVVSDCPLIAPLLHAHFAIRHSIGITLGNQRKHLGTQTLALIGVGQACNIER